MKHAFIVTLDCGTDTDFQSIAQDLHEALDDGDYPVLDVKPWAQHGIGGSGLTPPASMQPPTLT